jgi:hypothetical protein
MQTAEVRNALVLLLAKEDFRTKLASLVQTVLPDRPALGTALATAVADPAVAEQVSRILESPKAQASIWKAVDSQVAGRCGGLVTAGLSLLAKKDVRRLLSALRRHGLIRALRADRGSKRR